MESALVHTQSRIGQILSPVILVLAILGIWEWACWRWQIPPWLLPAPSQIVLAAADARAVLLPHAGQTLMETWLGLLLALIAGLALAVTIDVSPLLKRAIYPLLVVSQTVPIHRRRSAPRDLAWVRDPPEGTCGEPGVLLPDCGEHGGRVCVRPTPILSLSSGRWAPAATRSFSRSACLVHCRDSSPG